MSTPTHPVEREERDICVECSTFERKSKLNEDGLCFWCSPEGKAVAAELFGRGPDIIERQSHER